MMWQLLTCEIDPAETEWHSLRLRDRLLPGEMGAVDLCFLRIRWGTMMVNIHDSWPFHDWNILGIQFAERNFTDFAAYLPTMRMFPYSDTLSTSSWLPKTIRDSVENISNFGNTSRSATRVCRRHQGKVRTEIQRLLLTISLPATLPAGSVGIHLDFRITIPKGPKVEANSRHMLTWIRSVSTSYEVIRVQIWWEMPPLIQ